MLKDERHQAILKLIEQETFVSLEKLQTSLETSESTIRRDLDSLAQAGYLERVHGGARAIEPVYLEPSNYQKEKINPKAKAKIAKQALAYIPANAVIFIDPGTSTNALVDAIQDTSITVYTNSMQHAQKLVAKGIKTCLIGGRIKANTDATTGPSALQQIQAYYFDVVFMGINGIDEENLSTPDEEEAVIKRALLERGKRVYVLADETKLGQKFFAQVGPVRNFTLITQVGNHQVLSKIKEKVQVIQV